MTPTTSLSRLSLFTTTAAAVATALLLTSSTVFAQSTSAPVPVAFGGYTSDGEKTLYIRGGSATGSDTNPSGQFFALDLQTSWTTSSPAWRSLASSTGVSMSPTVYNSLAMTGPHTMVEWSVNPGITIFDLQSFSSTTSPYQTRLTKEYYGLSIAVDPTTATVYVPCGYNAGVDMAWYNPGANTIKNVSMPTTGELKDMGSYSFVWSSSRSSFLFFGGYTTANPPVCNNKMWEYKNGVWGALTMTNTPFTDVVDHCMVPAMGGTKMIMFGGQRATDYKVISGIYTLDTATMAWTAGTAAPSSEARRGMACTVSGDYFIAWGGTNGTVMGSKPLVYNMKTDQWVDQFLAPGDSGVKTEGSNIGVIAGGAGGAVVLIAIVLGLVFFRRRQQRKAKETEDSEIKDKEAEEAGPKASKKPGNDLKKNPQGHSISMTALTAGTSDNSVLEEDESTTMVDKDGRVVPRNPQSSIHIASGGLRNPQYHSGVYTPSTNSMYQNNPQYFVPGTQYQDMQFYPTIAGSPQLYGSSPYAMSVNGSVQSQDFSYPPVPPLAAMRRDSQARVMSGIPSNIGNINGAAAPMTEEILNLQIALVKAQQDQQFQLQQQNLARFRAEQEAQLQMLQQQLKVTPSSPSTTNVLSAPVPAVSPLMPPSLSSKSAPVPSVGSGPPSSSMSSPLTAAGTVVVETISKADAPVMDYVPAPVFAPTPAPSNATSETTTFVTTAPVSTVTSSDSDDTFVKPPSAVSAPVVTPT